MVQKSILPLDKFYQKSILPLSKLGDGFGEKSVLPLEGRGGLVHSLCNRRNERGKELGNIRIPPSVHSV